MNALILSHRDLSDQRWLDDRVAAIEDGIESVLDIARNWTELRSLSRLHPGVSAQDYILSRVAHPLGRGVIVPLLAESNWSNRQIAAVAGVSEFTVRKELRENTQLDDRPATTLGADGRLRAAIRERIRSEAAEAETEIQAAAAAMTPEQRAALSPEVMRQRGELMRLIHDLARLPDPRNYATAHASELDGAVRSDAARARLWLDTFCDEIGAIE